MVTREEIMASRCEEFAGALKSGLICPGWSPLNGEELSGKPSFSNGADSYGYTHVRVGNLGYSQELAE